MKKTLDINFINTYKPLLEQFMNKIRGVNPNSLPVPFLPYYGTKYEKFQYKIAFLGWETRNSDKLSEYIEKFNNHSNDVFFWFREDLDEPFDFITKEYGYMNNFGNDFWGFILKFLSKFHGIREWKDVKNGLYPDILKSFVWGNMESIERYEVTAKTKGADYQDWMKVKQASLIFDNINYVLNLFNPKILIVLHWLDEDDWLTQGSDFKHEIIFEDILEYYFLERTQTHVYWTRHPGSLSRKKIDFNQIIINILRSIRGKDIYTDFPGVEILNSIENFYHGIEEVGQSLDLSVEILPFWSQKAGIYFCNKNWKYCRIGFEFEDNWGNTFFGGICRADINVPIPSEKAISDRLEMKEVQTSYWPYWFWLDEQYKNWNNKLADEIQNDIFIEAIKKQVKKMQNALLELVMEGVQL